jgi:hypothetical protein
MQIEVLEKVMRRTSGQNREKNKRKLEKLHEDGMSGTCSMHKELKQVIACFIQYEGQKQMGHLDVDGSIVPIVPYSIVCKAVV